MLYTVCIPTREPAKGFGSRGQTDEEHASQIRGGKAIRFVVEETQFYIHVRTIWGVGRVEFSTMTTNNFSFIADTIICCMILAKLDAFEAHFTVKGEDSKGECLDSIGNRCDFRYSYTASVRSKW